MMSDQFVTEMRLLTIEDPHERFDSNPYGYLLVAAMCLVLGCIRLNLAGPKASEGAESTAPSMTVQASPYAV